MLQDVLSALKASRVKKTVVISTDPIVQSFTSDFDAIFLTETGESLNQALNQATKWCVRNGAESVLVLPADLPLVTPKDIDEIIKLVVNPNSIAISPSLNGGTNALLQRPPGIIPPHFGPGSFRRHVGQAKAKHVGTKIYLSLGVALDIDSEKEIEQLLRANQPTASHQFLMKSTLAKVNNAILAPKMESTLRQEPIQD